MIKWLDGPNITELRTLRYLPFWRCFFPRYFSIFFFWSVVLRPPSCCKYFLWTSLKTSRPPTMLPLKPDLSLLLPFSTVVFVLRKKIFRSSFTLGHNSAPLFFFIDFFFNINNGSTASEQVKAGKKEP